MEKFTLRAIRAQRNMTQAEVAKKMGVTLAAVSAWEQNKADMTARHFVKLCDVFNISRDDIFLPEMGNGHD